MNYNIGTEHSDWIVCKNRGIPLPFDYGVARSAMAYHILTDWMGDDGFIRRLRTEITGPFFYRRHTMANGTGHEEGEE
jgi:hypothetical protein